MKYINLILLIILIVSFCVLQSSAFTPAFTEQEGFTNWIYYEEYGNKYLIYTSVNDAFRVNASNQLISNNAPYTYRKYNISNGVWALNSANPATRSSNGTSITTGLTLASIESNWTVKDYNGNNVYVPQSFAITNFIKSGGVEDAVEQQMEIDYLPTHFEINVSGYTGNLRAWLLKKNTQDEYVRVFGSLGTIQNITQDGEYNLSFTSLYPQIGDLLLAIDTGGVSELDFDNAVTYLYFTIGTVKGASIDIIGNNGTARYTPPQIQWTVNGYNVTYLQNNGSILRVAYGNKSEMVSLKSTDCVVGVNEVTIVDDENNILDTATFEILSNATGGITMGVTEATSALSTSISDIPEFDPLDPSTWFPQIFRVLNLVSQPIAQLSDIVKGIFSYLPPDITILISLMFAIGIILRIFGR